MHRRTATKMPLGAAAIALAALSLAPSARADATATCATLQATLNAAHAGDTIMFSGTSCHGHFTLPGVAITLKASAAGAGFAGDASNQPILRGTNVGSTTIQGLSFTLGSAPAGGAIDIDGASAPQILASKFTGNTATTAGGAVRIVTGAGATGTVTVDGNTFGSLAPADTNRAPTGGALYLQTTIPAVVTNNTFTNNTATDNGGAATLQATGATMTIGANRVQGNTLDPAAAGQAGGAGLYVSADTSGTTLLNNQIAGNTIDGALADRFGAGLVLTAPASGQVAFTQSGNVLDGNSIAAAPTGQTGGGGEWIAGARVDSTNDRFTSNTVQSSGAQGGGAGVTNGELHAANLVATANALTGGGRGAGLYVEGLLELNDGTVAANCLQGAGSLGPGIAGAGTDILTVRNSIVYDRQPALPCDVPLRPAADVAGFGTVAVTASDLCADATSTAPIAGAGNICADPLLDQPELGRYDETPASPTVDRGDNAAVPANVTVDVHGNPRIADGNGDGNPVVDMGADEAPAGPQVPPRDTTPPLITFLTSRVKETQTGRVHIRVRCTEQSHCGGTLALTLSSNHHAAGTARFNILGGHRATVVISLRRAARAALRKHPRIRVTAKATARDLAGNVGRATHRLTVLRSRKMKR